MTTTPTRRAGRPRRRLRHAVRGRRPDRLGHGLRRFRSARPRLIGPPLESVLVRAAHPVIVDRRDQRTSIGPRISIEHRTTTVQPTLVRRIVDRTLLTRHDRTTTAAPPTAVVLRRVVVHPIEPTAPGHRENADGRAPRHTPPRSTPVPVHRITLLGHHPAEPGSATATRTSVQLPTTYRPARRPIVAHSRTATPHRPAFGAADATRTPAAVADERRRPAQTVATIDVDDITRRVLHAIDRRAVAQRERMGRR